VAEQNYNLSEWQVTYALDEDLKKWADDPNCLNRDKCAALLLERRIKQEAVLAAKRKTLQDNPFDPRTEVSADAKHIASRIVTHLWILFVLLPVIAVLLMALVGAIR
jgi:hypothetical protein